MRRLIHVLLFGFVVLLALGVDGYGRRDLGEACEIEKDEGTCHEHNERFFFDKESKCCKKFVHKGCRKNNNNFGSRKECYNKCGRHTKRMNDMKTKFHKMQIRMENPYAFFEKHKHEYIKNFKEALATNIPISTSEIKVLGVKSGSTILSIEIKRSFSDDTMKKFIKKIEEGKFTFVVAGQTLKTVHKQDVKIQQCESDFFRNWRIRKIAMIVVPVIVLIGVSIAIVIAIKVVKHKNVKAGPIETANNALQTFWKSNYPDSITMEKKSPPTDFVTADDAVTPPGYESVASPPPPYASQASLRGATRAEESHPTKDVQA